MQNFEIRFLLYYANLKKRRDENEPSFSFKNITVYNIYCILVKINQGKRTSEVEKKGNEGLEIRTFG